MSIKNTTRRNFITTGALTVAASILKPENLFAEDFKRVNKTDEKGLVFLFQGDSITDGNRGRNTDPNHIMGHGYAFAVASRLAADFAENNFTFYNRGISGNRIPDLKKRWQSDAIDLMPDVLSILIGINDVAAIINKPEIDENVDQFKEGYRHLLQQSKTANPDILFVLALPFVYPSAKLTEKWDMWKSELDKRKHVVKELAKEFDAVLVDYAPVFDKAFKRRALEYWIWDGIHPTIAGHELMAREWIRQVAKKLKFLRAYKY